MSEVKCCASIVCVRILDVCEWGGVTGVFCSDMKWCMFIISACSVCVFHMYMATIATCTFAHVPPTLRTHLFTGHDRCFHPAQPLQAAMLVLAAFGVLWSLSGSLIAPIASLILGAVPRAELRSAVIGAFV